MKSYLFLSNQNGIFNALNFDLMFNCINIIDHFFFLFLTFSAAFVSGCLHKLETSSDGCHGQVAR